MLIKAGKGERDTGCEACILLTAQVLWTTWGLPPWSSLGVRGSGWLEILSEATGAVVFGSVWSLQLIGSLVGQIHDRDQRPSQRVWGKKFYPGGPFETSIPMVLVVGAGGSPPPGVRSSGKV